MRLADGDAVARHQDIQHAAAHIGADDEIFAAAAGDKMAPRSDFLRHHFIQRAVNGAALIHGRRRYFLAGIKADAVAQLLLRQRAHAFALARGCAVFQRHQQCHIGSNVGGQGACAGLQAAFEENIGENGDQQQDRRDDDDQRTPEQAARQNLLDVLPETDHRSGTSMYPTPRTVWR